MCGPSELFDLTDAEKHAVMAAFGQMLRVVPFSTLVVPGAASPCAEPVAAGTPCTEQSP